MQNGRAINCFDTDSDESLVVQGPSTKENANKMIYLRRYTHVLPWCWLNRIHGQFNAYGRQFFNIYSLVLNKRWQRFCTVANKFSQFPAESSDCIHNQWKTNFSVSIWNHDAIQTEGNRYALTVDYSMLYIFMENLFKFIAMTLYIVRWFHCHFTSKTFAWSNKYSDKFSIEKQKKRKMMLLIISTSWSLKCVFYWECANCEGHHFSMQFHDHLFICAFFYWPLKIWYPPNIYVVEA